MFTKHTPGPWRVEEARGVRYELCFHQIIGADNKTIASTWAGPNERNARLIAAAPDLLAALAMAAAYVEGEGSDEECAVVEAAISKATGA